MRTAYRIPVWVAVLLSIVHAAGAADEMKPYPAADAGFARSVFHLPKVDNEADRKVEIMVGKVLMTDCNRTWFGGNLERRVAAGWGYPFFVLPDAGGPASTMMACPPGVEKAEAFVPVRGSGFIQPYNSKLPVVTYVPNGFSVRYRIWAAGDEIGHAEVR
jgi:ecotin